MSKHTQEPKKTCKSKGADDKIHKMSFESFLMDVQNSANKTDPDIDKHTMVTKIVKLLRGDFPGSPVGGEGFYSDEFPPAEEPTFKVIMKGKNFL